MRSRRLLYDLYLRSAAWKVRATMMRDIAQHRCEDCGQPERLQIHHLTYKTLGRENPRDLIALCDRCHQEAHHDDRLEARHRKIAAEHPATFTEFLEREHRRILYEDLDDFLNNYEHEYRRREKVTRK